MKTAKLIDRLVKTVPPLVEARFGRKDTCILSTAVAIDVFQHFGVRARPLVVATDALNAYAADCARRGEVPDPFPDEYWSVRLGYACDNDRLLGHMVAVQDRTLVDLTIGQAARPLRGIVLPPAFHGRFKTDPATAISRVTFANGSVVEYDPQPFNRSYLASDFWTDRSLRAGIVRKAIARVLDHKRMVKA